MPPTGERLDSWKAIAAYLRRDVRTVRRWEATLGLPVGRVPGGRGASVFAYTGDLDAWLRRTKTDSDVTAVSAVTRPRRAIWAAWLAAAAALVAIATIAWVRLAGPTRAPSVRFEVTTSGVVASDPATRERWRYSFPVDEQAYLPEGLPWAAPGDGTAGVFVLLSNRQRLADHSNLGGMLLSLGSDGRLRRQVVVNDRIRFGGGHDDEPYGPPWNCPNFSIEERVLEPRIAVAAHHDVWWPGLALLFDGRGERIGTFVNAGWIEDVHWLTGNRLLVNGYAEGLGGMVAVLDSSAMNGHSPSTRSAQYRCDGCGSDLPLRYVTFPPSELNIAMASRFNRARVMAYDDRILVRTEEVFQSNQIFDAVYEFSPGLELRRASYSDRYWSLHRTLELEGKIHHSRADCPQRDGPPAIVEWRPATDWRTIRVPHDPAP
jgi:hypothetical protein